MIIFIFTIGRDTKWHRIANGLAQTKLYGENWITLSTIEEQSKSGVNTLQMSKEKIFVFVGHADKDSYGGHDMGDLQYSPNDFVEKVAKWLPPSTETVIILGCELGFVQQGNCQALEIGKLLADKKATQPNLANLKNITSYLLEDKKFAPNKWLAGMIITLHANASLQIYAWDHEAESQFVKMRQQKFDLMKKGEAINKSIEILQKFHSEVFQTSSDNKLKEVCTINLKATVNQLSLIHDTKSETREKLLEDTLNYFRNNLFQFYTYENELKKKSVLTASDYCQWHFKCICAFQSCEQLLNLQNLYARDGSDKSRVIQSYNELQRKMEELKGKYNIENVDPSVVEEASKEMDKIAVDKQKYDDFKLKLVLLSEPNLNAHEALLDKERVTYETLIKMLEQPGCNLNAIKGELTRLCESKLSQLTEQKKMFAAKLEALDKIYEGSSRDRRHLIEGPIPIIELLNRPECNLLQRFAPAPTLSSPPLQPMPESPVLQHSSSTSSGTTIIQTTAGVVPPTMRGAAKK